MTIDPVARATDPATSHAAAGRVKLKAEGWPERILAVLKHGRFTDDELCRWLVGTRYRRWPTIKSARSRLKRLGYVEPSGRVREGQMEWQLKGEQ